jgi:hypothetical protein
MWMFQLSVAIHGTTIMTHGVPRNHEDDGATALSISFGISREGKKFAPNLCLFLFVINHSIESS